MQGEGAAASFLRHAERNAGVTRAGLSGVKLANPILSARVAKSPSVALG